MLETEPKYDYISIGNSTFSSETYKKYSGTTAIDTIHSSNFTVAFQSDHTTTGKGFVLNWNCLTHWEEWKTTDDGTCREAIRLQPEYIGADHKYQTKYRKSNKTCCEFKNAINYYCVQFYNLPNKRAQLYFCVLKVACHVSRLSRALLLFCSADNRIVHGSFKYLIIH